MYGFLGGSQNNLKICGSACVSLPPNIQFFFFYVISSNALIFGAGIFWGFDLSPVQSSLSLETRSTPLGT